MRNVRQLEGNDNSCKHMKVCLTAWHAFRRITKKKPASSRYSSAPACLAGLPGRHINERKPPKARTRFIYSIFFFCTGCTQKLLLTNCASFCCSNCCLPSLSLALSHSVSPLFSARIAAANKVLTRELVA